MKNRKRLTAAEAEAELDKICGCKDRGVELTAKDDDIDITVASVAREADELLAAIDEAELPDDKIIVSKEKEGDEILKACEEIKKKIEALEKPDKELKRPGKKECKKDMTAEDEECRDCKPKSATGGRRASIARRIAFHKNMIAKLRKAFDAEDIQDTAHGDEPVVSPLANSNVETKTDEEAFGKKDDSEYIKSLTARLDRVATALQERGMLRMAFRVDQLSDALEEHNSK